MQVDWLDEIDRSLSSLREREAFLRYEFDAFGTDNSVGLQAVGQERLNLLISANAKIHDRNPSQMSDDLVVRRKSELLVQQILLAQIDEGPDLLSLRNDLERRFYAYCAKSLNGKCSCYSDDAQERRAAHQRMLPYLEETEARARAIIRFANRAAREAGFATYVDAKLACQDFARQSLSMLLQEARKQWQPLWEDILARGRFVLSRDVQAWDIYYVLRALEADIGQDGLPADIDGTVKETLAAFGLDIAQMPIRIEYRSIPHRGSVHALKIGQDVRIVLGENAVPQVNSTLFHELGHAIYYSYAPRNSVLLLDGRIGREILAELWACLLETPEWMTRFSTFSSAGADAFVETRRRWNVYEAMTYLRETIFEMKIYENPDADFSDLWNAVTEDVLGFNDASGAYSEFIFLYPMDIKDYILCRLYGDALAANLRRLFPHSLLSPATMDFMVRSFYGNWNLTPWNQRLLCEF